MAKDLYSGAYLADLLGVSRNTIHQATLSGRIEAPAYEVHGAGSKAPIGAWSAVQVERIQEKWEPGKPGRPPKEAPPGVPPGPPSRVTTKPRDKM